MDSEELTMRFLAVDAITQTVEGIAKNVENLMSRVGAAGGAVGEALATAGGAIVTALGGMVAAGGVLFGVLDHLASKTAKYAVDVERFSNTLHVSTDFMQTMYQAGALLGAGQDQLNLAFARFAKNLEDGGKQLKAAGLDLAAVGITSSNVQIAFGQLADRFHTMDDASQKLAISTLFGRNAMATLIPILNLGSEGVARLTQEFGAMGLILNRDQLQIAALAGVIHEKLQMELKGLEMQVGVRLETAFMVFWAVMSQVLGKGTQLVDIFANALAQAVIWVAAFVAALTGTTITLDTVLKALDDTTAMLSLNQGAANADAGSIGQVGKANKDLTNALQDQVSALQDQQAAFDDAMQAETDAINAQKTAYDDLMDSEIAVANQQIRELELTRQQADANATLADLTKKLALDKENLAAAKFLKQDTGAEAANVLADQDAVAKQTEKMQFDAAHNILEDKVRALEAQKKAQDAVYQDQLKNIADEKKAHDDMIKDEIKGLQERLKEAQRASAGATDAALSSDTSILGSAVDTTKGITKLHDDLKNALTGNFASISQSGTDAFHAIATAVRDLHIAQIVMNAELQLTVTFLKAAVAPALALVFASKALFDVAMRDIPSVIRDLQAASDQVGNFANLFTAVSQIQQQEASAIAGVPPATQQTLTGLPGSAFGFQHGGMVPGPVGMPHLAVVHGGEKVSTPEKQSEDTDLLRDIRALLNHIANDAPGPAAFAASMRTG